jgi:hypothetical protein
VPVKVVVRHPLETGRRMITEMQGVSVSLPPIYSDEWDRFWASRS